MAEIVRLRMERMRKAEVSVRTAACAVAAAISLLTATGAELKVDFSRELGPVKPVNGVGQPPMVGALRDWRMFEYLKKAGIPFSRLHDVGGWLGQGLYCDIPNVFPDFNADENDPKSYRFAFTDSLMKALEANGVEPFYRLGVTIENWVIYKEKLPAINTKPPADYAKWARICEHVIRHYTEGWADGFRMKVRYWEIWNEPEGRCMFAAGFPEYMRLYGVVAPYLKAKFPHLKIGGYGSCGFYGAVDAKFVAAANVEPRMKHYVECAEKFLSTARERNWPLDFFSFHSYSKPEEALRQVRYADKLLSSYGFTADRCERVFDEWLPYAGKKGTARQAAAVAAELIGLQNGPCDVACIYDARCGVGPYSPLFNPMTELPHRTYCAFLAFNELRKRGTAVAATVAGCKALWAAAAKGGEDAAVMLANDSDEAVPLACDFQGWRVTTWRLTDVKRTEAVLPILEEMPPHSLVVIILERKQ